MRIILLIVASLTTACVSAPTRRPLEKTPTPRSTPGGVQKSGGGAMFGGGIGPIVSGEAILFGALLFGAVTYGIAALVSNDVDEPVPGPNVGEAQAAVCPLGPVSCDTHGR